MTEQRQEMEQPQEIKQPQEMEERQETEPYEPMRDEGASERSNGDSGQSDASAEAAAVQDGNDMPAGQDEEQAPLLAGKDAEDFRHRWEHLQAGFVDRPREVVEQADELVGELMQQLSAGFGERRSALEAQWEKGEDVSTEDLRVALTRYRSFFNRLLSA